MFALVSYPAVGSTAPTVTNSSSVSRPSVTGVASSSSAGSARFASTSPRSRPVMACRPSPLPAAMASKWLSASSFSRGSRVRVRRAENQAATARR